MTTQNPPILPLTQTPQPTSTGPSIPPTSTGNPVKRICQIVGLKASSYEEYKKCHANVWPEVLAQIHECHIYDCSFAFSSLLPYYTSPSLRHYTSPTLPPSSLLLSLSSLRFVGRFTNTPPPARLHLPLPPKHTNSHLQMERRKLGKRHGTHEIKRKSKGMVGHD